MKVGSLFAGIGGMDIAVERAGMEVAWQSETNKYASVVLQHHWPNLNLGDIHDITINQPDPARCRSGPIASAVDILVGGFPCQDYSVSGHRAGLVGDRGALWWQFLRLINEGRPTWVVAENVLGLLSSRNGQDFATIIDSLTEHGYGVVWGVLDAQWFGVAQRRRRVFIVAHSGGRPRPEILALSESLFGYPEPSREKRPVDSALTTSSVGAGGGADNNSAQVNRLIAFAQNQRDEVRDLNDLAGALAAQPGIKQQTYITNPQVRRLTPLECQRLQGFPDDWYHGIEMSNTQKYRQLGNAVAVPVAEWIMKRIAASC